MDKNLEPIATELFGKIRTQFPKVQLGDTDGKLTTEPEQARFFEFDFIKNGVNLGTVTVSIDNAEGLVILSSNDVTSPDMAGIKRSWFNFLKELRDFAKVRLMKFSIRDITKSNLDNRDYKFLANQHGDNGMTESKLWGTSKTSFQNMGESKIIVKHSQPVNYNAAAGRSMHIEAIFVENAAGERFRYPVKHLNGARAMARHAANGGTPYDTIGEHIIGLSEELNKLRMFKGYVTRNPVVAEAMTSIQPKVLERIDVIKKEVNQLQNQKYYSSFAESFAGNNATEVPEEILNDWVDRLTIKTFNEELKNVFPYIYKLVGEDLTSVKELTPDDLLTSEEVVQSIAASSELAEMADYEAFLENLVSAESNLLNQNDTIQQQAIQNLNTLMSNPITAGVDGTNAIQSISGLIDDSALHKVFADLGNVTPEADVRDIIIDYLQEYDQNNQTDIASKINFDSANVAPVAPEAPPAPDLVEPTPAVPPAAPAAPVTASIIPKNTRLVDAINRAMKAGAKLNDTFSAGSNSYTLKDAIKHSGMQLEDFYNKHDPQADVVEYVKSMYDSETGNFPKGETGVILSAQKEFGEDAADIAQHIISELQDGFNPNRLQELAGMDEATGTGEISSSFKHKLLRYIDPEYVDLYEPQLQYVNDAAEAHKFLRTAQKAGHLRYNLVRSRETSNVESTQVESAELTSMLKIAGLR